MAKFNTGQSFADGDTVTGAKLNNITSQLNIYTGVISEQAAMSATVSTVDQLLIADADNGDSGAANKITVQKLFDDSLTNGIYTAANLSGTITANRTVATSATITTGTIPTLVSNNATIGTTNGTLGNFTSAAITSGTITTALIPTLTAGTTTSTAGIFTSGTIATLNSTTGTIATLNSTTGTIGNLSTTLAGDFTISQGTATLATSGATAGTYGSVTAIPFITVDAKGRITSATTGTFSSTPADGSITPAKLSQPFTSATAVASTSSTAIVFTSIPSWAKRITFMMGSVAISTGDIPMIQLGYGGGTFATSGYGGTAQDSTTSQQLSSGILLGVDGSSGYQRSGFVTLSLLATNNWTFTGIIGHTSDARVPRVAGNVSIGGTLDRVRITTNSAGTFTAGSVNIMYEG
jgi:hypothetical protein